MEKKSYADTPEAAYLATLTWRWMSNTNSWVVERAQPAVVAKIKGILDSWELGYYADDHGCTGGQINLYVMDKQWRRAGIIRNNSQENKE